MIDKVYRSMKKHGMIQPGRTIIVGVSGGADSTCLLLILNELKKQTGMPVEVVHVNHCIRKKEAGEDQSFVQELCERLGVACTVIRRDVPRIAKEKKMTLEEAGRLVRYEAFFALAKEKNACVAVAHHRDDDDETMLFHLFRGAGLRGLTGMRPVTEHTTQKTTIAVIRPFLEISRREIEAYLCKLGQDYCTDATNFVADTARNHLRLEVLPLIRDTMFSEVSRTLQREREQFELLEDYIGKEAKKVLDAPGVVSVFPGVCRVKVDALNVCHPALLPYIFREMILHVRKTEVTDIFGVHLEKLGELVTKQSGKRLDLPLGLLAYREFDDLVIAEKTADDTSGLSISNTTLQTEEFFASADFLEKNYERITHLVYTKWVDCDKIKGTLKLRTRQPGDVLKINDGKNTKKLQDYFVEAKIPATFRESWPIVADDSEVVWVCGHRISDTFKITQNTKRILKLTITSAFVSTKEEQ